MAYNNKYNQGLLKRLPNGRIGLNIINGTGTQESITPNIIKVRAKNKNKTDSVMVGGKGGINVDNGEVLFPNPIDNTLYILSNRYKLPNGQSPVEIMNSLRFAGFTPDYAFKKAFEIQEKAKLRYGEGNKNNNYQQNNNSIKNIIANAINNVKQGFNKGISNMKNKLVKTIFQTNENPVMYNKSFKNGGDYRPRFWSGALKKLFDNYNLGPLTYMPLVNSGLNILGNTAGAITSYIGNKRMQTSLEGLKDKVKLNYVETERPTLKTTVDYNSIFGLVNRERNRALERGLNNISGSSIYRNYAKNVVENSLYKRQELETQKANEEANLRNQQAELNARINTINANNYMDALRRREEQLLNIDKSIIGLQGDRYNIWNNYAKSVTNDITSGLSSASNTLLSLLKLNDPEITKLIVPLIMNKKDK